MAMKKLWLTQIDKAYRSDDAVIGPWCFEGNETIDPDWFNQEFSNPFETENDLILASKQSLALFEKMAKELTPILNKTHSVEHSYIFWRHILAGWLSFLIHVSWVRYRHITQFIEQNKGAEFQVNIAPVAYEWPFLTAHDLIKNAPLPDFDYWLSSFMVDKLSPKGWILKDVTHYNPDIAISKYEYEDTIPLDSPRDYVRYPVRKVLYKYLKNGRFGNVYGTTWKERLLLSTYLALKPRIKAFEKPLYQKELISGYNPNDYFPEDYIGILRSLMTALIPESLKGDFGKYYLKSAAKKYKSGKIRVGTPDVYREVEKIETALAVEHGELVLQTQHGSWYGMVACSTVPQAAEYGLYGFMTWGWDKHDDLAGNFIPAPAPMLSKSGRSYNKTSDAVLFVNNKTYTRSSRLEGQPMPAQTVQDRADKVRFLESLSCDVRDNILYRPHMHHSFGIDDEGFIRKKFPDLNFLLGPSMNNDMLHCKLFVANHYSTGFHIAMVANIPSVCFWPRGIIPIAQSALPEHNALVDQNIIFDDPIKAAEHINSIWPSLDAWWFSDTVQCARENWCKKFSYTDENYLKKWTSILSKIGHSL
ncbi:MAG: hypothetical protein COB14_03560 [Alphaproteobacteria bacterium]|nr:MAG: hypothetical protein COB14_03560 [Alphaproteobacteria bacterium]